MSAVESGGEEEVEVIDLESLYTDRYERQKRIIWWNQDILSKARVLAVGAGTLGNEICKNLALLGIGHVTVVDFDIVEMVNLNRSVLMRDGDIDREKSEVVAERMKEINPEIEVVGLTRDLVWEVGAGFYSDFDIVIGGLDNREARKFVNQYCYQLGIPWIDGSVRGFSGTVQVILPPESSCYECSFTARDYELLSVRYSCPGLLIEDLTTGKVPMVATAASIIAAIQVQEAITLLHGRESTIAGKMLRFNGEAHELYDYAIKPRDDCFGHWTLDPVPTHLTTTTQSHKMSELVAEVRKHLPEGELMLQIDREINYGLSCPNCNTQDSHLGLLGRMKRGQVNCPTCGIMRQMDSSPVLRQLDSDPTLFDMGVPERSMIEARAGSETLYFLLA